MFMFPTRGKIIYSVISGSVPVIGPSILFPLLSIGDPFFHLDKFHNQRGGQLAGGGFL